MKRLAKYKCGFCGSKFYTVKLRFKFVGAKVESGVPANASTPQFEMTDEAVETHIFNRCWERVFGETRT